MADATNRKLTPRELELRRVQASINRSAGGPGVSTFYGFFMNSDLFENEDEARGALKLANQQGLDGMGGSVTQWVGYDSHPAGDLPKRDRLYPHEQAAADDAQYAREHPPT